MVFAKWTQLCFPSQTMAETQALESKNAAIWAFRRIGSLFYVFFCQMAIITPAVFT